MLHHVQSRQLHCSPYTSSASCASIWTKSATLFIVDTLISEFRNTLGRTLEVINIIYHYSLLSVCEPRPDSWSKDIVRSAELMSVEGDTPFMFDVRSTVAGIG
jgi:hypothetical protein